MRNQATFFRAVRSLIGDRRSRVDDWQGLAEAVRSGAAYLAQGSSYSYIRARTGMMGPRLFQEELFGSNLERCKWETFAVAAQDLILIVEQELRAAGLPSPTPEVLVALYRDSLALEAAPAHRRLDGWADLIERFAARAEAALAGGVRETDDICAATSETLLATAPIEDSIRAVDADMVTNNVAFRFIDYKRRLRSELDLPSIAAALLAQARRNRDPLPGA